MTIYATPAPTEIGGVQVKNYKIEAMPDFSSHEVVARILEDARRVARQESSIRRAQRRFRGTKTA